MEITKREILYSLIIIIIMFVIGLSIFNKIEQSYLDKTEVYNKSLKIYNDKDIFDYAISTSAGNVLAEGSINAIDTVGYQNEVKGEYLYISKTTERYTMHTRTVTSVDSDGHSHTRIETYWTWDEIGFEDKISKNIEFLDHKMKSSDINLPHMSHIDTVKVESNIRNIYRGIPIKNSCVLFANLKDGKINNPVAHYDYNINEFIETFNAHMWSHIFMVAWIMLTFVLILLFFYLDNNWLYRI